MEVDGGVFEAGFYRYQLQIFQKLLKEGACGPNIRGYAKLSERPEEKMHLLLFGAFGFLTLRLFGILRGVLICLTVAGIDELVQGIVPNRVADWHDVTLNSASALAGAVLGQCSVWP